MPASIRAGLFQHPFAAGNGTGSAWIHLCGHSQGPGKSLETSFDDVVRVNAIQLADVQGEACLLYTSDAADE